VSIYAASRDPSFDDIRVALGNLVKNFEADAATSRQQIRDLLDNDRELFYATSVEILKSTTDSRGAQYLVALLVSNGMLLQALCSPELSREEALLLGRSARRVDPMVDVALARSLADSAVGDGAIHVADPARLMDILCEIADPGRIMPSLMRMMRHPNPYLRSKAVKMIGRGSKSTKWVMGRLTNASGSPSIGHRRDHASCHPAGRTRRLLRGWLRFAGSLDDRAAVRSILGFRLSGILPRRLSVPRMRFLSPTSSSPAANNTIQNT